MRKVDTVRRANLGPEIPRPSSAADYREVVTTIASKTLHLELLAGARGRIRPVELRRRSGFAGPWRPGVRRNAAALAVEVG